jgi:hypothetical protein
MRPHADRVQAAILRAVAAMLAPHGVQLVIEELRCRDWASLTLVGGRHELDIRLEGEGAAAALARLQVELPELDIAIAGHILAELVVVPAPADDDAAPAGSVALSLRALAIQE